ncbi:hypothetical protein [Trichococcus ilyis]|jgi:hypothetical protein|uniref:hypothetical protein n=1 Tax=Trichococcus ilyis TaxID=640938 RepID=UPI0012EE5407|nr:hypothetical protein [Trichococcus ilyis]
MKKFIVLSLVLGIIGSTGSIVKEATADANKDVQHEQVAKAPTKYSTNMIWFIG